VTVELKRKKGESFEAFLRRFNKTLIKSQRLNEARARQYLVSKPNKRRQKEYVLMSKKLREEKEYLRKIGKLKDDTRRW
jgi:ribosomal protein S21